LEKFTEMKRLKVFSIRGQCYDLQDSFAQKNLAFVTQSPAVLAQKIKMTVCAYKSSKK
jgi:hypothetical protein